jgi:hypothetical protein
MTAFCKVAIIDDGLRQPVDLCSFARAASRFASSAAQCKSGHANGGGHVAAQSQAFASSSYVREAQDSED